MTPDGIPEQKKAALKRGIVYLALWLVCFASLLEQSSGLLENGLIDLFDSEQVDDGSRTRLIVFLVLSILFLALGMNNLFYYFRRNKSNGLNEHKQKRGPGD